MFALLLLIIDIGLCPKLSWTILQNALKVYKLYLSEFSSFDKSISQLTIFQENQISYYYQV